MENPEPRENGQKAVAWVPCGDIDHTPEGHPPNWSMVTTSPEQARYWKEECFLRVRAVYLGDTI